MAPVHPHVATGGEEAKFGVSALDALAAWTARERWPHLKLDGLHLHVGSQILESSALERAMEFALELRAEAESLIQGSIAAEAAAGREKPPGIGHLFPGTPGKDGAPWPQGVQ